MRYRKTTTAFNGGELSPFALGRYGLEQYQKGCSKLRNITSLPQGGVIRRTGFDLVASLGADSNIKRIPFSRGNEGRFMMMLTAGRLRIYRGVVQVHEITTGIPYTAAQVNDVDFAQLADSLILTHQEQAPLQIMWNGSDVLWLVSPVALVQIPQFNFDDASSPAGINEIQEMDFREFESSSDENLSFFIDLGGFETEEIQFSSSSVTTAANIREALLALTITPSSGINVVFQTSGGAFSGVTVYVVTFSGAAQDDWPQMTARDANATADAELNIVVMTEQQGQSREENVWSNTRGWPRAITFFENRMWLANTRLRRQTFWASRINEYFDFNQGDGMPSDSFEDTLSTAVNTTILAMQSGRELQIMTESSEHYCPVRPVTPENHPFPQQTTNGSKSGVRPVDVDGATYFAQARGTGIRQFVFQESEGAYTSDNPSVISEHLITDVIDLEGRQGVEEVDANYLYAVNQDGTVAVYNLLRAQGVATWSAWENEEYNFYRLGQVDGELWAVVERAGQYYLCKANEASAMDMTQRFTNASSFTMSNPEAYPAQVSVVADGLYLGEFTHDAGVVTLSRVFNNITVGVNFVPIITPCDIADTIGAGINLNKRKRIHRAYIQMVSAIGWVLEYANNDYDVPYRQLPLSLGDPAPKPFTGTKELRLLGYIENGNVTIKQPFPFARAAITALTLEVQTI